MNQKGLPERAPAPDPASAAGQTSKAIRVRGSAAPAPGGAPWRYPARTPEARQRHHQKPRAAPVNEEHTVRPAPARWTWPQHDQRATAMPAMNCRRPRPTSWPARAVRPGCNPGSALRVRRAPCSGQEQARGHATQPANDAPRTATRTETVPGPRNSLRRATWRPQRSGRSPACTMRTPRSSKASARRSSRFSTTAPLSRLRGVIS